MKKFKKMMAVVLSFATLMAVAVPSVSASNDGVLMQEMNTKTEEMAQFVLENGEQVQTMGATISNESGEEYSFNVYKYVERTPLAYSLQTGSSYEEIVSYVVSTDDMSLSSQTSRDGFNDLWDTTKSVQFFVRLTSSFTQDPGIPQSYNVLLKKVEVYYDIHQTAIQLVNPRVTYQCSNWAAGVTQIQKNVPIPGGSGLSELTNFTKYVSVGPSSNVKAYVQSQIKRGGSMWDFEFLVSISDMDIGIGGGH